MTYAIVALIWLALGLFVARCMGWCARREREYDVEVLVDFKSPDVKRMTDEDLAALLRGK